MPSYTDMKYINLISTQLHNFQRKNENLYNFRCPFCGDSVKKKSKARGYLYQKRTDMFFHCHNCGQSNTFGNFLKQIDQYVHRQYVLERYKDGTTGKGSNTAVPEFSFKSSTPVFYQSLSIPKLTDLPETHFARKYVTNRGIPDKYHSLMHFAQDFKSFVDEIVTDKSYHLIENDPRLVIPFYDENKELIALQGRAFMNSKLRYITIKTKEDAPKIFGLDRVDFSKQVYVVEGPIDSLFLENSVAMAGSDFSSVHHNELLNALGERRATIVFDNEPRNLEILKKMELVIRNGWNICIWPTNIREKDLNDMFLSGLAEETIKEVINTNTHYDLMAKTQLAIWRKK